MSSHDSHTLSTSGPDDLDRLLLHFFQGALPREWPAAPVMEFEASTTAAPHALASGGNAASRWALLASIAMLMGVCWYVGSGTATPAPTASQPAQIDRATAGDADILDEMARHKAVTETDPLAP